jgi:hypothetical protein
MNRIQQITKLGLSFVVHQIVATEGVIWFTVLSVFILRRAIVVISGSEDSQALRGIHWLMVGNPVFPVHVVVALWIGYKFFARFPQTVMFWVWVLPCFVLTYAVVMIPTLSPWSASVLNQHQGRFAHYFGLGCRSDDFCFDQFTITLPFYTSVAYTIGARMCQWSLIRKSRDRKSERMLSV